MCLIHLFDCAEVESLRNEGFPNVIYQIKNGYRMGRCVSSAIFSTWATISDVTWLA